MKRKWTWGEKHNRRVWTKKEFNALKGCECYNINNPQWGIFKILGTKHPMWKKETSLFFVGCDDGADYSYGEDPYSFCESHAWREKSSGRWRLCGVLFVLQLAH